MFVDFIDRIQLSHMNASSLPSSPSHSQNVHPSTSHQSTTQSQSASFTNPTLGSGASITTTTTADNNNDSISTTTTTTTTLTHPTNTPSPSTPPTPIPSPLKSHDHSLFPLSNIDLVNLLDLTDFVLATDKRELFDVIPSENCHVVCPLSSLPFLSLFFVLAKIFRHFSPLFVVTPCLSLLFV